MTITDNYHVLRTFHLRMHYGVSTISHG